MCCYFEDVKELLFSIVEIIDIDSTDISGEIVAPKIIEKKTYANNYEMAFQTKGSGDQYQNRSLISNPKNHSSIVQNDNDSITIFLDSAIENPAVLAPWKLIFSYNVHITESVFPKYNSRSQRFVCRVGNLPIGFLQFIATVDLEYNERKYAKGHLFSLYLYKKNTEIVNSPFITIIPQKYCYCPILPGQHVCVLIHKDMVLELAKNRNICIVNEYNIPYHDYKCVFIYCLSPIECRGIAGVFHYPDKFLTTDLHKSQQGVILFIPVKCSSPNNFLATLHAPTDSFTFIRNGCDGFMLTHSVELVLNKKSLTNTNQLCIESLETKYCTESQKTLAISKVICIDDSVEIKINDLFVN